MGKKGKMDSHGVRHTVSAGGVVVNRGRVAVVCQRGEVWSLPKGHLEKGESAVEAARREIEEETGIHRVEYVSELGSYERPKIGLHTLEDPSEMKHIEMFLFTTDQESLEPEDRKILSARWVAPGEVAPLLTHPKDRDFFLGVLDRVR